MKCERFNVLIAVNNFPRESFTGDEHLLHSRSRNVVCPVHHYHGTTPADEILS